MAPDLIHVPALAGMQLARAEAFLKDIDLVAEVIQDQSDNWPTSDIVITTNPPAGSLTPLGSTVVLIVSSSRERSTEFSVKRP